MVDEYSKTCGTFHRMGGWHSIGSFSFSSGVKGGGGGGGGGGVKGGGGGVLFSPDPWLPFALDVLIQLPIFVLELKERE